MALVGDCSGTLGTAPPAEQTEFGCRPIDLSDFIESILLAERSVGCGRRGFALRDRIQALGGIAP